MTHLSDLGEVADVAVDWTTGRPVIDVLTCQRCGNHWYLPRAHCPVCGSDHADRTPARGTGLCVAVTTLHVTSGGEPGPVRLGLVELDEGPVVMGRVHDENLAPGDRAAIHFRRIGPDKTLVPSFIREA